MRIVSLLAVALAAASTGALAADLTATVPGYTYFHRAGATLADHDAALRGCIERTARTISPPPPGVVSFRGPPKGPATVKVVADIGKGAFNDLDGMVFENIHAANIENCMVVLGWDVRQVDVAEGARLAALPRAAKAEWLSSQVGAPRPASPAARAFANDAHWGSTRMFAPSARPVKPSLSLATQPATTVSFTWPPAGDAPPVKVLKTEQVAAAPADAALVLVRLSGKTLQAGQQLVFRRTHAGPADTAPDTFVAALPSRWLPADGETYDTVQAFAVPPGEWRLSAMRRDGITVDFCLGQPTFPVAAGGTVFAGWYTLGDLQWGPRLDPSAARSALPADRAGRLKAAAYANGATGECGGTYIYALEIPGAPFVEGYRDGTAATPAPGPGAVEPSPPPAKPRAPGDPPVSTLEPEPLTPIKPSFGKRQD
ncbi:hypothetical protein [Caulobacter sp. UNC358MFTsu5.1]|uniref:hypothetical protein n=1 Tax=Caulobacter sp. UNC358MFTsu5.1 TaxID=1449049 RepID=UPI000AAC63FF|nr:hypothetical protein [Caulobacter sp. UNC358MFTsu5.1]